MFRCILYIRPTVDQLRSDAEYVTLYTQPLTTWDAANRMLEEWYATKTRSGWFEVCGGSVQQKVEGVGWVECHTKPQEPFEVDDIVVILGPNASWA